jgi:two-component system chemotaxis sensor kinase CheA
VRRGLLAGERAENLDSAGAIDLIFHPGFSTRTTVSELSGRGVGMDVVRAHVERLGGEIAVRTTPGAGTSFIITVPLTLATTRVLLVEDHGELYAVPSSTIERTGRVRSADLLQLEGRRAIQIEGRAVPVVELADVLQRPRSDEEISPREWRPYFVLPHGDRAVALLTTHLVDEQELVIKALGAPLKRVKHIAGAAVLGTGAVVVILSPGDLTKTALGNLDNGLFMARMADLPAAESDAPRRRVLVVDDSVMTRTLERSILEAAGYEVVVAVDGQQALDILGTTAVDAIVSDVEMPRLNGFALTAAIRQSEQLRHLPVVLVTSLDAPEQVERGAAAGADAYIVKGRFDQQDLLRTLERLL